VKLSRTIVGVMLVWTAGCGGNSATTEIKGSWSGPLGAVLQVTDKQWIVSTGLVDVTLDYQVTSSDGDTLLVSLKTQNGDVASAKCIVSGSTLRITQPVSGAIGIGGTWTRK
jgi:hypothetical protein